MGIFSYIKKRKRNTVLAILLFTPFKGLVDTIFFCLKPTNLSKPQLSFLEHLNNLYTAPPIKFEYRNDEWYFYFFEQGEDYVWILAIILFALIIYTFNDRIKAK